jgi:hypothetical protein
VPNTTGIDTMKGNKSRHNACLLIVNIDSRLWFTQSQHYCKKIALERGHNGHQIPGNIEIKTTNNPWGHSVPWILNNRTTFLT